MKLLNNNDAAQVGTSPPTVWQFPPRQKKQQNSNTEVTPLYYRVTTYTRPPTVGYYFRMGILCNFLQYGPQFNYLNYFFLYLVYLALCFPKSARHL